VSRTDALRSLLAAADEPWAHDFFALLRRIEATVPEVPRLGTAARPADEPVRLGQQPSLAFTDGTLAGIDAASTPPRIAVNLLGLLGPNGPLPTFLTEFARARLLHRGDRTFVAFLDMLQHRFIALYYRAWAQAQPTVSRDRPHEDRFAGYLDAMVGLLAEGSRARDAVPIDAKRFNAGLLARGPRSAAGLVAIVRAHFGVPARLEQFAGHWLTLDRRERTRLASRGASARLGLGAVLGRRVWDRQHKFRLTLGPLDRPTYESFLPGGRAFPVLADWIRTYTGDEYAWDVRLLLAPESVPRATAGVQGRLGWTAWIAGRARSAPAGDLVLDPARFATAAPPMRTAPRREAPDLAVRA